MRRKVPTTSRRTAIRATTRTAAAYRQQPLLSSVMAFFFVVVAVPTSLLSTCSSFVIVGRRRCASSTSGSIVDNSNNDGSRRTISTTARNSPLFRFAKTPSANHPLLFLRTINNHNNAAVVAGGSRLEKARVEDLQEDRVDDDDEEDDDVDDDKDVETQAVAEEEKEEEEDFEFLFEEPAVEPTNMERAWRYASKPLMSVGSKGATLTHGNSLRQLLEAHTVVKVKANTRRFDNSLEKVFERLRELAEQSGAPRGIELLQAREKDKIILFGMPGTRERIEKGEFPPKP